MPPLSFSGQALGFGNASINGVQPELLHSFQVELGRRWDRINGDIRQFNRQYGHWGDEWTYLGGWNSIDLGKSADARWYGGLEGLLSKGDDNELAQSALLPLIHGQSNTKMAGERIPAVQMLVAGNTGVKEGQRAAVAWVGVFGASLKTQPGTCSVLAADHLLTRKAALLKKELGPAEKKELQAIELAIADLGKASSRLEDSGPFWGHQGWNYRPRAWTFQEPTVQAYRSYNWSYDVTRYAAGLYSNSFDVLNEIVSQYGMKSEGNVSDAARKRIKAARDAMKSVKIRYTEDGPEMLVASGDRFAMTRRTDMNLEERMVCDGEQVLHLYGELGLAARRPATMLRRASLRQLVPHLVESTESLAMRFNIELENDGDERFTLKLTPIDQTDDAKNKVELIVRVLADGRVQDKTMSLDGETQLRLAFEYGDGQITARWFDKDNNELGKFAYHSEPLADDVEPFQADLSDYVVFDMPLRKPSYYVQQLESLSCN